jgi:hypothetical protein
MSVRLVHWDQQFFEVPEGLGFTAAENFGDSALHRFELVSPPAYFLLQLCKEEGLHGKH